MELFSGKTLILKEMTIRLAKEMEALTEARNLKEKCGNSTDETNDDDDHEEMEAITEARNLKEKCNNGTDETNNEEEENFLGNITLLIDD